MSKPSSAWDRNRSSSPPVWPLWPRYSPEKLLALERVLRSGRWAISGDGTGAETEEEIFSREFAAFTGATYCIPTDHGSSALVLAFQAMGLCPGDEVIVPGLTWVACAAAPAQVGARPVLADVDPDTLCLSRTTVEPLITERTRAVLAVHLYCSVASEDLAEMCRDRGLVLVEDCAQAHGARIAGRHVGTMGAIGVFSMQQGKPMTSGEGGCCITDDEMLADRIYRLRTDSRRLGPRSRYASELTGASALAASNRCLSEFQCALLREELRELPSLHQQRAEGARILRQAFKAVDGIDAPRFVDDGVDEAFYHLIARLEDPERLNGNGQTVDALAAALTERLGIWIHPVYDPLDVHPLWSPDAFKLGPSTTAPALPNCHRIRASALAFPHRMLLAEPDQLEWVAQVCRETLNTSHTTLRGG